MAHTIVRKARISIGVKLARKLGKSIGGRSAGWKHSDETRAKIASTQRMRYKGQFDTVPWASAPKSEKRRRVMREQMDACLCGVKMWNGKPITLEFHHEDGNSGNDSRENVSLVCPNCHSQTPTYRMRNVCKDKKMHPGLRAAEYRRRKLHGTVEDVGIPCLPLTQEFAGSTPAGATNL